MWSFLSTSYICVATSWISFVSSVIMLSFACTRIYKNYIAKMKCFNKSYNDEVNNENFDLSPKPSSSSLQPSESSGLISKVSMDEYFEKRKKCKRVYFTCIPKVRKTKLMDGVSHIFIWYTYIRIIKIILTL